MMPGKVIRVGLISDTHDLLRREASVFLAGSDYIVHAGDIGAAGIIEELSRMAPVTAVRGNNDTEAWGAGLEEYQQLLVGAVCIHVVHDLAQLGRFAPGIERAAGVHVVVSGHSHKPSIAQRSGVMYVNPGSAGPRRFKLPIAIADLVIKGRSVSPRIVDLSSRGAAVAAL